MIYGYVFVGRADKFICDKLHLNGIATAGFAEEMQRTIDNSMCSFSYLNWVSRGYLLIDGMDSRRMVNRILVKTNIVFVCLCSPFSVCVRNTTTTKNGQSVQFSFNDYDRRTIATVHTDLNVLRLPLCTLT